MTVNAVRALVIDASPDALRVMVGPGTTTGPLEVAVGGVSSVSTDFTVLGPRDAADLSQDSSAGF